MFHLFALVHLSTYVTTQDVNLTISSRAYKLHAYLLSRVQFLVDMHEVMPSSDGIGYVKAYAMLQGDANGYGWVS